MRPSGATCPSEDYCFSERALYVGLVKNGPHYHLIEN
jgi:hypothetical protein